MNDLYLIKSTIRGARKILKDYKEGLKGSKNVESTAVYNALIIPLERDLFNVDKWLHDIKETKDEHGST